MLTKFIYVAYRDSVGGTAAKLRAGRFGVPTPFGTRGFSVLRKVQTVFGAHPDSSLIGTGVPSPG